MKKPSTTLVSWHESNSYDYITEYAKANELSMSGEEWERALAAARRLDYTGNRHTKPNMRLTSSQRSLVGRVVARLLRRTAPREHLSELDDIQSYLVLAPNAAQQSQISWGPLRNGFGTWVMATLRPGGQQFSRVQPHRDLPRHLAGIC